MTRSLHAGAVAALIALPVLARPAAAPPAEEPASRGTTGICGAVTDAGSGEALIEAPVAVVRGGAAETRTDVDGLFALELAPGVYDLRARYELYQARRVNGVTVVAGECTRVRVGLAPQDEGGVDEVIVTARKDARREAAVLAERRVAPVVQDAISAQEISRTPDGAASDAVKRVVSATVIDDRVFLRGLGGRYSNVLLNGVPLPSPDADEHSVPLDIFPTSLLSSLSVVKTYSAHLPGSFAGGTLLVETTGYPARAETSLRLSTSASANTTGRSRASYDGGGLDWLGFDDGTRALPDLVPTDRPMTADNMEDAEHVAATRAFHDQWSAGEEVALPGLGLGFSRGDTLELGGRKLGYLVSLDYGAEERSTVVRSSAELTNSPSFHIPERYRAEKGTLRVDLTGLAQLGYELGPDDDLSFLALYTHSGESIAQRSVGVNEDSGVRYEADRLQFVERGMAFGQLRGEHRLESLGDLDLGWELDLAHVARDEPDTRDVLYSQDSELTPLAWAANLAGSADRFFSGVRDTSGGAGLELRKLFEGEVRVRAGVSAHLSDRRFDGRRFEFFEVPDDPSQRAETPEVLFGASNVTPSFLLREVTEERDGYTAREDVLAGHAAVDLPVAPHVRLIPGLRYEASRVELSPGSRYAIVADPQQGTDRADRALLPSVNAVWALAAGQNLRAGWSYTMVRPQFRELAPFVYRDFDRKRTVEGNPGLESTRIHNADLRWEWFLGDDEVLAASAFYKRFANPIELVITSNTGGQVRYQNAERATVYGLELEARLGLARLTPALAGLRVSTNLALVSSEVDLGHAEHQTSQVRPLQGQSAYVVNAALSWTRGGSELSALYNVFGERISEVGAHGLPDGYEQPFHRLDVAVSQRWRELKLKLAVTNLLDARAVVTHGGVESFSEEPGIAGSLSLTWSR